MLLFFIMDIDCEHYFGSVPAPELVLYHPALVSVIQSQRAAVTPAGTVQRLIIRMCGRIPCASSNQQAIAALSRFLSLSLCTCIKYA